MSKSTTPTIKFVYTKDELEKMTEANMLEFMSFGSDENTYFYSDIKSFNVIDGEYVIRLKDNAELYVEDEADFKTAKLRKIRYDMIQGTMAGIIDDNVSREKFRSEIAAEVKEQVTIIKKTVVEQDKSVREMVSASQQNIQNITGNMERAVLDKLQALDSKLEGVVTKFNAKLSMFNEFNSERYDVNMKNIEKIATAFKDLLK